MSSIGANYFDDDDFLLPQATASSLTWRADPNLNWSDWTIVITSDASSTQTYHVHRNILAAGPRRCDYFYTLFHTRAAMAEHATTSSRISLSEEEAAQFPLLLDFIYSQGTLDIHVGNVVTLRSLARYFQCRELLRHICDFVQRDLTIATAVLYLRNAFERDEKLENASKQLIVENIHILPVHSMDTLPIRLFRSIICHKDILPEQHAHVSIHVKSFLNVHPENVTAFLVNDFTQHLTKIDASVAHGFLKLIETLTRNQQQDDEEKKESWLALDELSRKCAAALAPEWNDLNTEKHGMKRFLNSKMDHCGSSGRVVVPLLEASLKQAQVDYKQVQEECAALKRENQVLERKVVSLMGRAVALESLSERMRIQMNDLDSEESSLSSSSSSSEDDDDDDDDDDNDSSDSSNTSEYWQY